MADAALEQIAVTLEDLMHLGSDARVEVINGVVVEMAPVGGLHHIVNANIYNSLKSFVDEHELGAVFMDGLLYLMNENAAHLRGSFVPDISFIRRENIPANWTLTLPFPGVPDLAVEVMSPSENAEDVQTKIRTYLDKGTEQVWVAYPATREVYQYHKDQQIVHIYKGSDLIDAGSLLPGFILTLDAVFKLPSWAEKLDQGNT